MPHFYWPEIMITEHDIYTQLSHAFPDVDAERMQELVTTYVHNVAREFKPNEAYTWTDPVIVRWVKLRAKCGVFLSGGQVHNVLDSFHRAFPLMAVVRLNSNFGNYSVTAVMFYPHLMTEHFNEGWLLGTDDPQCYRVRDMLMRLYDCRKPPEPAVRLGPKQVRAMTAASRAVEY